MASSITFVLRDPKASEPSLIYLIFRCNSYTVDSEGRKSYRQFKFSTGLKWNPRHWSVEDNKGIDRKDFPDPTELNQRLRNMEMVVADIYRKLINDRRQVTSESIRAEIDKRVDVFPDLKRKAIKASALEAASKSVVKYFEDYLANLKYVYKKGQPYPVTNRSKQRYATTLRHLRDFSALRKKPISFEDIDIEFYQDFVNYLRTQVKEKPSKNNPNPTTAIRMADNTVGKHISTLKTVLLAATEAGINKNTKFQSKKFASITEEVDKIYLTTGELDRIYALDLSASPYLDRVRDIFLIGCYTCLRFSDFNNIQPDSIYNTDQGTFLRINTLKTGKLVVIPIHFRVMEILTKYKFDLPKSISNQKMNDYLKIIGERAGINHPISMSKIEGGLRVTRSSPKFNL
ncbi:MAG: site-specific integrase, partial [Bacteroidetes bacterium]|nr:site-specific integrase [Bacteroidota bacterium]